MRWVSELAYADFIGNELPNNEFFGEIVRDKLVYYPTVTREPFRNQGRITELLENGKLCQDIGIPQINPETDRAMICGSPHMLADISAMLDARGFTVSRAWASRATTWWNARSSTNKAPRRSRRTACSPKYKKPIACDGLLLGAAYIRPRPRGRYAEHRAPRMPARRAHSGWIPAFLMMSPHFAASACWKRASSSGVELAGSVPVCA